MRNITLFLLIFIVSFTLKSQSTDSLPKNYFRSPLGIPLYLAGNFGELRSNHFHSGLDMKTQGREGFNIYAAADGYVSRVKISPWGYGNTIYIDHPNGFTTVYAHLQRYKGEIADFIKEHQYEVESWEIDWYPNDTLMKVKKGDIIALSGNSGGSGGPHLHFEIRETKSEHPINPLLCGFDIKDNVKPIIKRAIVFPLNDTSYVNNKNTPQTVQIIGSNGNYNRKYSSPITAYGQIGIGIETIDKLNDVSNRNGIYSIQLSENSEVIYKSEMKKFSFDESRALNSLIDYETYLRSKTRYQKSFIEDNNPLSIYTKEKNNGIVSFSGSETKKFDYLVTDSYGNSSTFSFSLIGKKPIGVAPILKPKIDTIFSCTDENTFNNKSVIMELPKGVLYKDLAFQYRVKDTMRGAITPTYQLHNDYTPLHDYFNVSIKVGRLNERLRDKAIIVNVDRRGKFYSRGGEWRNNYLSAKSKTFGGFTVMLDTIPPSIKPYNIFPNKNMVKNSSLIMTIGDNLSGVKSYRGEIDGKWVMMEYKPKKAQLIYVFDQLPKGKHTFKLTVTDGVKNVREVEIPFTR